MPWAMSPGGSNPSPSVVIGVYGIIGSGKSRVAQIFREKYDFKIISADEIGHKVINLPEVKEKIVKEFGRSVLDEDSYKIDRTHLGDIVFSNLEAKKKLEDILWQYMTEYIKEELKGSKRALIDATVLFKAGWNRLCNYTIYVHAPVYLIFLRLLNKRKYPFKKILYIIKSQKEITDDGDRATFKIYNNSSVENLSKKVDCIWKKISP